MHVDYVTNEYGDWKHVVNSITPGTREIWYRPARGESTDPEISYSRGKYIIATRSYGPATHTFDTLELAMLAYTLMYG